MNVFLAAIRQFTTLSPEGEAALGAAVYREAHPKGHVLLPPDQVCERVYFLESGLARTFYYKDGRDVTDWLAAEGEFVGSIASFLTQPPDRRSVVLLEPAVLWVVPQRALTELYARHHDVERLGRLLVSFGLVQLQERFDELHFATAAERYQRLLHARPSLLQRVPLGIIASYLGISAETLSRIRGQV